MKRLVVNADDFGMAEGINEGILEAHLNGILTSATLLANGEAFDSAVAGARNAPRLGVGVHLNLTQGRPIADPAEVSSLVHHRGQFFRSPFALLRGILSRTVRLAEIDRELAAQIERVRDAGIEITHLDGHMHVQMLPGVFQIVLKLAKRCGIRGVRCAREQTTDLWGMLRRKRNAAAPILGQYVRSRALALVARGAERQLREAGLAFPRRFYGIMQTGFLDESELGVILRGLAEGTSELMCHPGYANHTVPPGVTRLVEERQRELEALTGREARKLVAELGIQLINYHEVLSA